MKIKTHFNTFRLIQIQNQNYTIDLRVSFSFRFWKNNKYSFQIFCLELFREIRSFQMECCVLFFSLLETAKRSFFSLWKKKNWIPFENIMKLTLDSLRRIRSNVVNELNELKSQWNCVKNQGKRPFVLTWDYRKWICVELSNILSGSFSANNHK